ncbi:hypothetical protein PQG02_31115 (plasmid) [Nostoc sp. UHCC 0926]|uniref:hypothetical protein n=1 Tax=Nostoc sp. UHCC 0926 TaxID=3025190 RepID=UPI00235DEE9D|nr:hypothetical protein [Nostoc sp. UHCC 0926]WDD36133.1 hypothetical protein PQG02_31115 [Nostoc sp. UHCC 0926]
MPLDVALASGGGGITELFYAIDHDEPRLSYELVVVISNVGYQFFAAVNLVVVEVDFYGCQVFGGYGLGLGCDVVVKFGLGEVLFVGGSGGDFLNLACLIVNNGANPCILAAFIVYFDCAGDFAVNLLQTGNRFQL